MWTQEDLHIQESLGREKTEDMIGIQGESITFRLKTSRQFTKIAWLRLHDEDFEQFAAVRPGPPCQVESFYKKFNGRLNASEDCKSLQITDLRQEDSATYRAQTLGDGDPEKETFKLQVYKRLLEDDLKVECKNNTLGGGNYTTLQLNCSAGQWEHGVKYTWASSSESGTLSHGKSLDIQDTFQDNGLNYTCTAANPVGNASTTVSLKQTCKAAHPTTGPETVAPTQTAGQNGGPPSSAVLIAVGIVLCAVVTAVAGTGYLMRKKKKRAACSVPPDPAGCPAPDESGRTIYAQIGCLPTETGQTDMKKAQPEKRAKSKDGLHTVYASVVQPKPTPLQTDDEKIQMEGQRNSEKSKKTIYSAVTKSQETDDPSIKTVYDTVGAPRRPGGSEFNKLL